MTTDRDDIASCPFCGDPPVVRRTVQEYPADGEHPAGEYDARVTIDCDTCGISMGEEYRDDAIAAWNRRKLPASSPAPSASMGRVTAAKVLADWLGYSWDGLNDRGRDGYPDWAHDGTGRKRYQGGKEGLLRLVAAIDSPPDHGGGEGWVVVPREPTEAMHKAAWAACDNDMKPGRDWPAFNAKLWRAMLASLPTQESEERSQP